MNVFITVSNAKKIEFDSSTNPAKPLYLEDLYKLSLWMLSNAERERLALARMFYSAPEFYVTHFHKKIEKNDNEKSNLVYTKEVYAYHRDFNCLWLNQDYINFTIPYEIRDRGDKAKQQFREWFNLNKHLLDEDPVRFSTRMDATFNLKSKPPVNEYKKENSGVTTYENISLPELEQRIDQLLQIMKSIRDQNELLIDQFGKRTHDLEKLQIENKSDIDTLKNWDQLKGNLKSVMRTYYRLKFNPDLKFEENVLSMLGFRPCKACYSYK